MKRGAITKNINEALRVAPAEGGKHECYLLLTSLLFQLNRQMPSVSDDVILSSLTEAIAAFADNGFVGLNQYVTGKREALPNSEGKAPVFKLVTEVPPWLTEGTADNQNWYSNASCRDLILMRDLGYCVYCGADLAAVGATYDHIIPQESLKNHPQYKDRAANIVSACASCNFEKANCIAVPIEKIRQYSRREYIKAVRDELRDRPNCEQLDKLRKSAAIKFSPELLQHDRMLAIETACANLAKMPAAELGESLIKLIEKTQHADTYTSDSTQACQ